MASSTLLLQVSTVFLSSKVFVKIALLYSLYACVIKLRQDSVISTRLLPIGRLRASQHLLASISKMRSLCVSGLFLDTIQI